MNKSFTDIRQEFPVAQDHIYLNHAAMSPLPTRAVSKMSEFLSDWHLHGRAIYPKWEGEVENARSRIASLAGADVDEIAFTQSTTAGVLMIAHGLDLRDGDNVVTADIEHPANVYPWLAQQSRGVQVRFVRAQQGRLTVDMLKDQMDSRTRVVALSFVEFGNGFRNDLAAVAELCSEYNAYFFVDAIQGFGALEFDVKKLGIDFFSAGGYKWLCGPAGTACVYCRRELWDRVSPLSIAWKHTLPPDYCERVVTYDPETGRINRDVPGFFAHYEQFWSHRLHPSARRFEEGMPNLLGLIGLGAAVEIIQDAGIKNIERHLLLLTDHLVEGLQRKDYVVLSPRGPHERSQIVSFGSTRYSGKELYEKLTDAGVCVSLRSGFIRVSPHFYNTAEEIDAMLDILP